MISTAGAIRVGILKEEFAFTLLEEELAFTQNDLSKVEAENQRLQDSITRGALHNVALAERIDEGARKVSYLTGVVCSLEKQLEESQAECLAAVNRSGLRGELLDEAERVRMELESRVGSLEQNMGAYKDDSDYWYNKYKASHAERNKAQATIDSLTEQLEQSQAECQAAVSMSGFHVGQLDESERVRKDLERSVDLLERRVESFKAGEDYWYSEWKKINADLDKAQATMADLNGQLELVNEVADHQAVQLEYTRKAVDTLMGSLELIFSLYTTNLTQNTEN